MVLVDFALTSTSSFNDIKTWYSLIELTVSYGNGPKRKSIQPKKYFLVSYYNRNETANRLFAKEKRRALLGLHRDPATQPQGRAF